MMVGILIHAFELSYKTSKFSHVCTGIQCFVSINAHQKCNIAVWNIAKQQ